MNCTICEHYGSCKEWKEQKKFYDSYPNKLPPMNYHRQFLVTEQGAHCGYFQGKNDKGGTNET